MVVVVLWLPWQQQVAPAPVGFRVGDGGSGGSSVVVVVVVVP